MAVTMTDKYHDLGKLGQFLEEVGTDWKIATTYQGQVMIHRGSGKATFSIELGNEYQSFFLLLMNVFKAGKAEGKEQALEEIRAFLNEGA